MPGTVNKNEETEEKLLALQCPVTCGLGYQSRTVGCRDDRTNRVYNNKKCSGQSRPARRKRCPLKPCQPVQRTPGYALKKIDLKTLTVRDVPIRPAGRSVEATRMLDSPLMMEPVRRTSRKRSRTRTTRRRTHSRRTTRRQTRRSRRLSSSRRQTRRQSVRRLGLKTVTRLSSVPITARNPRKGFSGRMLTVPIKHQIAVKKTSRLPARHPTQKSRLPARHPTQRYRPTTTSARKDSSRDRKVPVKLTG